MLTVRELISLLEDLPEIIKDAEFVVFDQTTGVRVRFDRSDLRMWHNRIEMHGQQDKNQR